MDRLSRRITTLKDGTTLSIDALGGKLHIPFYILVEHLHKEAKLCALQIRLVSDGKLMRIKRQTYSRLQGKIFELWDQYASKDKTAEQLLRACSQLYGPVLSS